MRDPTPISLTHARILQTALRHANDAVMITNADLKPPGGPKIITINHAFTLMTGYTPDDLKDRTPRILQGPKTDRRTLDRLRIALKTGEPFRDELINYRKDGTEYYVECRIEPVRTTSGKITHWVAIQRDTTQRKRTATAMRRLGRKIRQAQKLESLGILAGGIAHDFNNLLMGILGNADLALTELPQNAPGRQSLQQIQHAAMRAADLCKQMLAYSGRGKYHVQPFVLSDLVSDMAHLLEVSISKTVTLIYNFEEDLPTVEADVNQIRQVVMNLITNASEAIGKKKGTISISTGTMNATRDYLALSYLDDGLPPGRYVYLEVTDSGCGMNEKTQSRMFDPFYTTKFTGRGLGLAAVIGIVRGHRGAIHTNSRPDRGTSIRILLPCSGKAPQQLTATESAEQYWQGVGTILVVDDVETVRNIATRMLQHHGFTVMTAADGYEALEIFRKHHKHIAAVILDMTMPDLDGRATYNKLKQLKDNVPVIVSSGHDETESISRFTSPAPAGFIQKPYRRVDLISKVKQVLAG